MKYLKKFEGNSDTNLVKHEITEANFGYTHIISDTNATFVIDGEEYGFTIRESGEAGGDYNVEFLPDHNLPFDLTEEMKDEMYQMYLNEMMR